MTDSQWCGCAMRKKAMLVVFIKPEHACGVPDSAMIDFMQFDEQGYKTVLRTTYCPWCGKGIDPTEKREITPSLGELLSQAATTGAAMERFMNENLKVDVTELGSGPPPEFKFPEEFSFDEDGAIELPDELDFEPPDEPIPDPE